MIGTRMKKYTSQQKDHYAPNINSMMTSSEANLRSVLLKHIIEQGRPFFPEEIKVDYEKSMIESLSQKGVITLREDGTIVGVYPVSALPTRHKVKLKDGRLLYAMCAIDSLGVAYELGQDVLVSSSCMRCDKPISMEIQHGRISQLTPSTTLASHVSIEKYKDWASTC